MTIERFKGVFPLGQLVMTRGVADKVATDTRFAQFVTACIARHATGDWGTLCEEDKKENEYSLTRHLRLFSAYDLPEELKARIGEEKLWVITEADRSVTTSLWPSEY